MICPLKNVYLLGFYLPGRWSMAIDLMEEFRVRMCNGYVLILINERVLNEDDFEKREDGTVLLDDKGRKTFLMASQKRKTEMIIHLFWEEKVEGG